MPERRQRLTLFRVVYKLAADNPLPARDPDGRFHLGEHLKVNTCYLSEEEATCWAEIEHNKGVPADPCLYKVFQVKISPSKIVDLTDTEMQKRYGITRAELEDEFQRGPCQKLGERLRAEGIQAVRTFSAPCRSAINVVLFAENLDASCKLAYKKITSTIPSRRTP